MLKSEQILSHVGKKIASIEVDGSASPERDMVMARRIKIAFDDGSSIDLAVDWRGDDAYISQDDGIEPKRPPFKVDPSLTSEGIEESRKTWEDAARAMGLLPKEK